MFGRKSRHPGTSATTTATGPKPKPGIGATKTQAAPSTGPSADSRNKGKLAYEARRAEKAGMGLDKWMVEKGRRAQAERDAAAQAKRRSDSERLNQSAKPGLLRRLLDRAHRPL